MKPVCLLLLLAAFSESRADIFTVTNANSSGQGSLFQAFADAAFLPAGTAAEIRFDTLYFSVPRTIRMPGGGLAAIRRTFTIEGPPLLNGSPSLTISGDVNANGIVDTADRVPFYCTGTLAGSMVTIRRLAMTGCPRAVNVPAGEGADLTLEDCAFTGNVQEDAGAVFAGGSGSKTLSRCRFADNSATGSFQKGGAVTVYPPGIIEQCVFSGNYSAGSGGAVSIAGTSSGIVITDCRFTGNSALNNGSAIYAGTGVTVRSCTFDHNDKSCFQAYNQQEGEVTLLENCTFTANLALTAGSALNCYRSQVVMRHCTLTGNKADSGNANSPSWGGAVSCTGTGATVTLTNCIVAGNTAGAASLQTWDLLPDSNGVYVSGGGNIIGILPAALAGAFSQSGDLGGTAASPLAASLGPLQYNGGLTPTCAPIQGSPAINQAIPAVLSADQRGILRPSGPSPDAGAVEFKILNYTQWAALYPFAAGAGGQNDDPDGDQMSNLLEYFTGTDPLAASPSVMEVSLTGNQMRMTYPVADHVAPNIFYPSFQISQNLTSWNPSVQSPVRAGQFDNASRYEVFFNAGVSRRFVRMQVEQVPPN